MSNGFGAWLERLTGADGLSPTARAALLSQQLGAISEIMPSVVAGAGLTAIVLLWVSAGGALAVAMVSWASCLFATLGFTLYAALRGRSSERSTQDIARPIRRMSMNALVLGIIWGALPIILFQDGSEAVKMFAGVAIAGVLSGGGLALVALPQAAVAFGAPVIAGTLIGLGLAENAHDALVLGVMLVCFSVVMTLVSLRHARNFVAQRASEMKIREQKDIISLLLKEFEDNSSDWLWEFDRDGFVIRVSERFAEAAGRDRSAIAGIRFTNLLRALSPHNEQIVHGVEDEIAARETFADVEIMVARKDGEHWWRLTGKPAFDDSGAYAGYIGTASDVTAEKTAERRINFLAHNDPLTGLLNRAKFTDHLKQCVARLERYGSPFTVLYLDLDQFKSVNDSRGHMVGDKLLALVARRIRSVVREADIAARLGGDEFALILNNNCDAASTGPLAGRLVEAISKPYEIDDEIISIGVSIGIAMAPINGTRPDQILRNADLALYRAKGEGKGVYRFFESQMDSDAREKRMLELELRQALKDGELVLHYQPLVSAEDNRASGFEALMRWNHPIRGLVPPSEFIPIAEQSGLIKQVGDWTIHEACRAAMLWPEDLLVAVNLSAKHFQLSDIPAVVADALAETGLPPHRLELEITESLLIERPEDVIGKLQQLKALGVTIAMDDFGTGYSSLSYTRSTRRSENRRGGRCESCR